MYKVCGAGLEAKYAIQATNTEMAWINQKPGHTQSNSNGVV